MCASPSEFVFMCDKRQHSKSRPHSYLLVNSKLAWLQSTQGMVTIAGEVTCFSSPQFGKRGRVRFEEDEVQKGMGGKAIN